MRRRRIRKTPIIIILLFICLVFGSLFFFKEFFEKKTLPLPVDKETTEKNYSTTFTLAGNVLLNKEMWNDAKTEEGKYNFDSMFEYLNDIMKKSDLNFYTEESVIGGSTLGMTDFVNGVYSYNAPEEVGDALIKVGFNSVSLAGYHAYDKGINGITNSIKYWDSKKIMHSGANINNDDRLKNNIFEKDGIKIALLSYTLKTDTTINEDYAVNIYSEEKVKSDVEAIKKNVDVVMVSIDWTDMSNTTVTESQQKIVNYLVSLGVNIIVGNTGNTIEPIEIIDNTLVCYSLGNLLSGHAYTDSRISAIVDFELNITKKGTDTTIKFNDIDVLLTYTSNQNATNYKVIPFSKITNELVYYDTYYNKYKELLTKDKDYINMYSIGEQNGDNKSQS